ncbi:hypothetical protein BH11PLA2_BH11PLA2_52360 [soil metagenome]
MAKPVPIKTLRTRHLTVEIAAGDQKLKFQLCSRPLKLTKNCTIQYYWMDLTKLRKSCHFFDTDLSQKILQHWLFCVLQQGQFSPDRKGQYVSALCYGLVANHKSLQNVFKDAFLSKYLMDPRRFPLTDEYRKRVRRVVRSRSVEELRIAMDDALIRLRPDQRLMPRLEKVYQNWIQRGIDAYDQEGYEGLVQYLGEIDFQIEKFRKKSDGEDTRQFLNLFSCECKAAFHECYSHLWKYIIPWLKKHEGLDIASERFLRFWVHYQSTIGGVKSAFDGQVLALHPLSSFFTKTPEALETAGKFFATPAYDKVFFQGKTDNPRYWKLAGAILTAAYQYRLALERQPEARKKKRVISDVNCATIADKSPGVLENMKQYFVANPVKCPKCQNTLAFNKTGAANQTEGTFLTVLKCGQCHTSSKKVIKRAELLSWCADQTWSSTDE